METIWIYNLGNWKEVTYEEAEMQTWDDGEYLEQWLEKNKYCYSAKFSLGVLFPLMTIYPHKNQKKWYVDIDCCYDDLNQIIILNTPSKLMFLKEFKSIFDTPLKQFIQIDDYKEYININQITKIKRIGGFKKDDKQSIICFTNEDDCSIDLRKSTTHGGAQKYLKENFGIE